MPKTKTGPAYAKHRVVSYMKQSLLDGDHLDCGEVQLTSLAEDAAFAFNAYGPEPYCDIPEDFFEWAADVAEWYVKQE